MSDDVQQVSPPGPEEAWERLTDDPDVRGIETVRVEEIGGWQVTVCAMEFVRDGSLETDMRLLRYERSTGSPRRMNKIVRSGS